MRLLSGKADSMQPNYMHKIKHVVYYMLENRWFDNVLGWLYPQKPPADLGLKVISNAAQKEHPFYGLEEQKYYNQIEGDPNRYWVRRGVPVVTESDGMQKKLFNIPSPDPHEQQYGHVNIQLYYPHMR
jgi:phospholipase C